MGIPNQTPSQEFYSAAALSAAVQCVVDASRQLAGGNGLATSLSDNSSMSDDALAALVAANIFKHTQRNFVVAK